MIEELRDKFNRLSDEEKIDFMKAVMPSFCQVFSKNPEKLMPEMMPLCRSMMSGSDIDMQGMMKMMGMMGGMGTGKR